MISLLACFFQSLGLLLKMNGFLTQGTCLAHSVLDSVF